MQVVDLVFFGRPVAAAFGRDDMHHRGTTKATDLAQGALNVLDVVTSGQPITPLL